MSQKIGSRLIEKPQLVDELLECLQESIVDDTPKRKRRSFYFPKPNETVSVQMDGQETRTLKFLSWDDYFPFLGVLIDENNVTHLIHQCNLFPLEN